MIHLLLLLDSKHRARSTESSFSHCGRSGSCRSKCWIRELGLSRVTPGTAPHPGGGGTVLETSTSVPPCSSVWTLGGILVPSTTDRLTFCGRKAEGETENTNNEELVRDEEVWVHPASCHRSARGHGYPSAVIWWLHLWGIPLVFFLAKLAYLPLTLGVVQIRVRCGVESSEYRHPWAGRKMQITPCLLLVKLLNITL